MSYIPEEQLGRYEFIDYSINSEKFWHIIFDIEKNMYLATWGRIGKRSPQPKAYTAQEAAKKIREKVAKGYKKNNNSKYKRVKGSSAIAFILSLAAEDGDGSNCPE